LVLGVLVSAVVGLAGVMLAVLLGGTHAPGSSPPSPLPSSLSVQPRGTRAVDPIARSQGVAVGVSLPSGSSLSGQQSFARLIGVQPRILMWYQTWDGPLSTASQLRGLSAGGATPMISWDPIVNGVGVPMKAIAAGEYDGYLISTARLVARWRGRLYIRFAHEMNLPGSAFGPGREGNTAQSFVSAWRHVVDVFRRYHATNVEWVWAPNVYCGGKCPFTSFYPGDHWVDWAGLDGYNYGAVDDVPWMTFRAIFAPSYAILAHLTGKPVMITETASTGEGGDKSAWIRAIAPTLAAQMTHVRALVWFDRVKETDWRVNSSPAALKAFRELVRSPTFTR
jgi:glycosyl hydrolase family 26